MRILLLSNSKNPGEPLLDHATGEIKNFLGAATKTVLFVPFASISASWDNYAEYVRAPFREMGYDITPVHAESDPAAAVERAEAVYVGGGNTFQLLRALYDTNILGAIRARVRAGVPYIGASAGTNVACPTIKTTNDMPVVEPPSFDALGLVPFQINPHYTDASLAGHGGETRDDRIKEFLRLNPGVRVVGLREGTMLRLEGNALALVGDKPARIFVSGAEPAEHGPGDSLEFLFG